MISCMLMGGLGNQLFQIFAVIAYAIEHNHRFIFNRDEKLTIGVERNCYWNNFLSELKPFTYQNANSITSKFPKYEEPAFAYNPIPKTKYVSIIQNNINLYGYFQTYKYFEKQYGEICKLIGLDEIKTKTKVKYSDLFSNTKKNISMHFRLGDYKYKQDCHPVLPYEYYENALYKIRIEKNMENARVIYFCEEEDKATVRAMVETLKPNFYGFEFVEIPMNIVDWEQLVLMSVCDYNIIANSSFSWWGAYFNSNPDKFVLYPGIWFGPAMADKKTHDLFPPVWTKIDISKN